MAYSWVAAQTALTTSGFTIDYSAASRAAGGTGPANGDGMVLLVSHSAIRDYAPGAQWTLVETIANGTAGSDNVLKVYARKWVTGDATSTVMSLTTGTAHTLTVAILGFTGTAVGSAPLRALLSSGASNALSLSPGPLTVPAGSDLVAAGTSASTSARTFTGPGTERAELGGTIGWLAAYTEDGLAGGSTGTRTVTQSSSAKMNALVIALEPVAAGDIALTVQGGSQAATVIAVTLTQAHVFAADGGTQAASVGTVALAQDHALAVDSATQASAVGGVTLAAADSLTVQGGTQPATLDAANLTQQHVLAVGGGGQASTLGAAPLTQDHALAPAGNTQGSTVGEVTLTTDTTLTVAGGTQASTVPGLAVTGPPGPPVIEVTEEVGDTVAAQGGTQASTLGSVTISQQHVLAVDNAPPASSLQAVTPAQVHTLAIADAQQLSTLADAVALAQVHALAVQGGLQASTLGAAAVAPPTVFEPWMHWDRVARTSTPVVVPVGTSVPVLVAAGASSPMPELVGASVPATQALGASSPAAEPEATSTPVAVAAGSSLPALVPPGTSAANTTHPED